MDNSSEYNFYDDLSGFDIEGAKKLRADAKERGRHLDYLIHKVFAQNEAGVELLETWKESLIMTPIQEHEYAVREGMNRFIRGILLTVKRVEKGE